MLGANAVWRSMGCDTSALQVFVTCGAPGNFGSQPDGTSIGCRALNRTSLPHLVCCMRCRGRSYQQLAGMQSIRAVLWECVLYSFALAGGAARCRGHAILGHLHRRALFLTTCWGALPCAKPAYKGCGKDQRELHQFAGADTLYLQARLLPQANASWDAAAVWVSLRSGVWGAGRWVELKVELKWGVGSRRTLTPLVVSVLLLTASPPATTASLRP